MSATSTTPHWERATGAEPHEQNRARLHRATVIANFLSKQAREEEAISDGMTVIGTEYLQWASDTIRELLGTPHEWVVYHHSTGNYYHCTPPTEATAHREADICGQGHTPMPIEEAQNLSNAFVRGHWAGTIEHEQTTGII